MIADALMIVGVLMALVGLAMISPAAAVAATGVMLIVSVFVIDAKSRRRS